MLYVSSYSHYSHCVFSQGSDSAVPSGLGLLIHDPTLERVGYSRTSLRERIKKRRPVRPAHGGKMSKLQRGDGDVTPTRSQGEAPSPPRPTVSVCDRVEYRKERATISDDSKPRGAGSAPAFLGFDAIRTRISFCEGGRGPEAKRAIGTGGGKGSAVGRKNRVPHMRTMGFE